MGPIQTIRVLIVEDDERLAKGLARNLGIEGFEVATVHTGEAALEKLEQSAALFDFVVLDIMLPGIDGYEVCSRLRSRGQNIPILFLTARGSDADRVFGLRSGADDYLTKPFVVEELILRIRGILRRSEWSHSAQRQDPIIKIGAFEADLEKMRCKTRDGTQDLTEREALLLRFFSENPDRVLSRGELLERVWGYTFDTSTRTLDTFIHRLRKYFEEDPRNPRYLHTIRGVGYRFTPDPET